jgi:hypothetical protein
VLLVGLTTLSLVADIHADEWLVRSKTGQQLRRRQRATSVARCRGDVDAIAAAVFAARLARGAGLRESDEAARGAPPCGAAGSPDRLPDAVLSIPPGGYALRHR